MHRHLRSSLVGLLALASATAVPAAVLYVQVGAPAGGTGTCASPFDTIAAGLAAAKAAGGSTEEIRVGAGTYPERDLTIDFSDVHLKGGYPAGFGGCGSDAAVEALRNPATNITSVDATLMGRHFRILPQRGVGPDGLPGTADDTFAGTNILISIDGFELVNAKPAQPGPGGSILTLNCEVTLSNSTLRDNQTLGHFFGGGAIYLLGYATAVGTFNAATLDMTNVTFLNNRTGDGSVGSASGPGGAIFAADLNFDGATAQRLTRINATGCVFRQNVSAGSGNLPSDPWCLADADNNPATPDVPTPNADCTADGIPEVCQSRSIGGAAYLTNVGGTWTGCTFESNSARATQTAYVDASGSGGAMAIFSSRNGLGASPTLTNNTFRQNTADAGRGSRTSPNACGYFSAWGGALYLVNFDGMLTGNTIDSNTATAVGNAAPQCAWGGGVFMTSQNTAMLDNNMFTGNSATAGGGAYHGWGGGLLSTEFTNGPGAPQITNNTFGANMTTGGAGGTSYGGGLMVNASGYQTLIAHNVIEDNMSSSISGFSGIGGGMRLGLGVRDQLVADNIVRRNTGHDIRADLNFAGVALLATALSDTAANPTFQNNLVVENLGGGVGLIGFPEYDTNNMPTGNFAFASSPLINDTIAANDGAGIIMNVADGLLIDSTILWDNDRAGTGTGDILDNFLRDSRDSANVTVRYSDIQNLPLNSASLVASFSDPSNMNLSVDPLFVTGPRGNYYLRQQPDNPPPTSPMVDAGPVPASQRDFGTNPGYLGVTMAARTTRAVSQTADLCFVDIGFHFPLGAPAIDTDMDGIPDADELVIGTNPNDADSDDDGLVDGVDCGGDIDGDGTIAALDCDTDGDGLTDGTESGVTVPPTGTNIAATCDTSNAPCGRAAGPTFTADADRATRTNYLDPDTDGGGELDGCEDVNKDGRFNGAASGERNPLSPGDDDADRDGLNNGVEGFLGTNPNDADTDDDGVSDGQEANLADPNETSDPINCDTDGDTIMDGVERSLGPVADPDGPSFPAKGTDCPPDPRYCTLPCFVPDADPTTQTWTPCANSPVCEGADTDSDGCTDGAEDANHNGRVDAGETDPRVAGDCVTAGTRLNIDDRVVQLLDASQVAACGPLTRITEDAIMATPCNAPILLGCNPAAALAAPTRNTSVPAGPAGVTLPGEAAYGASVLTFYELMDCTKVPRLRKSGNDLVVIAQ